MNITIANRGTPGGTRRAASCGSAERRGIPARRKFRTGGFSVMELLVAMTLLSLIVFALMAVFSSTQRAFRASVTQTDVLEGSRAATELIAADLRNMTPCASSSNVNNFVVSGAVNFCVQDNNQMNNSYPGIPSLAYAPLQQNLPGSAVLRTNLLQYFFILGRENMKWTGVGYAVNATNTASLYPLYRFYSETNVANSPYALYAQFINTIYYSQWTNLSHVMDGVVNLTVRGYDANGAWMTHTVATNGPINTNWFSWRDNTWFAQYPSWGEYGFYCFSNAVPAAVELEMGVLEDRTLQRVASLGDPISMGLNQAQSNYLSQQSGHVHMFRQRVTIPNVDPTAYQ